MIDFAPVLKIMPLFAVALIVPGPDFMLISTLSLSRGRLAGILAAAGIALGTLFYIILCMFGLGVVFAKLHWLMTAIRIFGGVYLVFLGIQLWRASFRKAAENPEIPNAGKNRNPFMTGLLTNLTNPKAMAFFTSVFALILSPDTAMPTQLMIIAVMLAMSFGWFCFVALSLSAPALRRAYMRGSRWIDRVSGTFLTLFGLRLMFSRNS